MERAHDEMLDGAHEPYHVGDLEFQASDVLRNCDPVAYRCSFADFCGDDPYVEIEGRYYFDEQVDRMIDEVLDEIPKA